MKYFTGKAVADTLLEASTATTFQDFVQRYISLPVPLGITSAEFWEMPEAERKKAKLVGYFTACAFPKTPWRGRLLEHARPCNLLLIDIDNSDHARPFVDDPSLLIDLLGEYNFAVYKTISSTPEKPRLRVMVDADSIPVDRYPDAVLTVAHLLGLPQVTRESVIACQPMFRTTAFSDQDPDIYHPFIVTKYDGKPFTVEDISTDPTSLPGLVSGNKPSRVAKTGDSLDDLLTHYVPPDEGVTLALMKDALTNVDADCSRPEWLDIAAALKHQFTATSDEEAYTVFDEWSATGTGKYVGSEDTATVWKSFSEQPRGRKPITIATLIMRAKQGGWNKPNKGQPNNATEQTPAKSQPLPAIVCCNALLKAELAKPRPVQLIGGMLHIGEKLLLAGASKSYKSWTLLDMGVSVATGTPFLGMQTTKGRVLLINYEIGQWFYADRLNKVKRAKGVDVEDELLEAWNLRGHRADFDRVLFELQQRLMTVEYALVIIDPLYSGLAGRSENDAAEMAGFMQSIEKLTECGPAVALGHHFAKGNSAMRESLDRASGSGVFARDPDCIVTLNRHQTDGAFVAEFTLRNFPPLAPQGLKLKFPLLIPDCTLNVENIKGAQVRKKSAVTAEELVALLPMTGGIKTAELVKRANEETGASSSRIYALLKEAKAGGLICNNNNLNERVPANSSTTPQLLQEYSEE
jgi:hypothetical protein